MAEDIEGLYPRLIRTFIKIRDARSEVKAAWDAGVFQAA